MQLCRRLRSCVGFSLEENTYDEYENDLGITAIALYDYQAGEGPTAARARGLSAVSHLTLLSQELVA